MPHIKDQPIRWDLWSAIFISLAVFKRDKLEEVDNSLMTLYYEFAMQLQDADFTDLLKITHSLMLSEKLMSYVNGCKVRAKFILLDPILIFRFIFSSSCQASSRWSSKRNFYIKNQATPSTLPKKSFGFCSWIKCLRSSTVTEQWTLKFSARPTTFIATRTTTSASLKLLWFTSSASKCDSPATKTNWWSSWAFSTMWSKNFSQNSLKAFNLQTILKILKKIKFLNKKKLHWKEKKLRAKKENVHFLTRSKIHVNLFLVVANFNNLADLITILKEKQKTLLMRKKKSRRECD